MINPVDYTKINELMKAYTAGLLDRGSFHLKAWNTQRSCFRFEVRIFAASISLSEWLHDVWGFTLAKTNSRENCLLMAKTTGVKAATLVKMCLPYMIAKRDEGLIGAAFYEIMARHPARFHKHLTQEEKEMCEILCDALIILHGVPGRSRGDRCEKARSVGKEQKEKLLAAKRNVHHENIFDFFDGTFTQEHASKAKSIFDDLLPRGNK